MDFVSLSLFCDLSAFEMVVASEMAACSQVTNKDWGALWQSRRHRMGSGFYSGPDHCSHMELCYQVSSGSRDVGHSQLFNNRKHILKNLSLQTKPVCVLGLAPGWPICPLF